ncbi:serine/arginine repetitive matrix protein 1 [Streptomyces sp. NPDC048659]|uniref:serine/arginine repetitive matrix protein 1 n=1 Tax=Streptomyces sp. NPDC048659 TaxID=3155489 RepID=UPI00342940E0
MSDVEATRVGPEDDSATAAGECRARRWSRRERVGSVPPQRPGEQELDFPPVLNGLDYLASVVELLDAWESEPTPRNVKYAVVHLQSAVEVLFKARLFEEHWSLVFADPNTATRSALDSGDFASVSTEKAIDRLVNIVGIPFSQQERRMLRKVREDRNKLQHFGMPKTNARLVEARAGQVLDLLIRFVETHLVPSSATGEREVSVALAELRAGLNSVNAYVKKRMDRVRGELKEEGAGDRTVMCPSCEQMAMVVRREPRLTGADPDHWSAPATCRFCSSTWPTGLLFQLSDSVLGDWAHENACPRCAKRALGFGVPLHGDPENVHFCFACATGFRDRARCEACQRPIESTGGTGPALCGQCGTDLPDEPREPDYEEPADYGYTGVQG